MIVAQPGPGGWNAKDLSQVEALLRLRSYPRCAAVAVCLERWQRDGEGYQEDLPMPGGDVELSFNDKNWGDLEQNDSSSEAAMAPWPKGARKKGVRMPAH